MEVSELRELKAYIKKKYGANPAKEIKNLIKKLNKIIKQKEK